MEGKAKAEVYEVPCRYFTYDGAEHVSPTADDGVINIYRCGGKAGHGSVQQDVGGGR